MTTPQIDPLAERRQSTVAAPELQPEPEAAPPRWYDEVHAVARTAVVYAVLPPWTVFWSLLGLAACRLDSARSVNRVWVARGFFNPGLLSLAGIRVEVAGLEHLVPGHPYLYASNHQGHLDIPALVSALPTAVTFITKMEIFKVPLFGRCLLEAGHIPVIRERRAAVANDGAEAPKAATGPGELPAGGVTSWTPDHMIQEAIRRERLGDRIVIFPEGTRTSTGDIAPFKAGMAVIARGAGVPVVPLAIHGSDTAYGRDKHLVRPGVIRVSIGEPVAADDPDLTEKVRAQIIALRAQAARGGPEFVPADGVLAGALRCEERLYPGSGAAPNPMLGVFEPAPRRLVLVAVDRCLGADASGLGAWLARRRSGAKAGADLRPGMVTLVRHHQRSGDVVALVGSGPTSADAARELGIDHVVSIGPDDSGEARLQRAQALAQKLDLPLDEAVFYSASVPDALLLQAVKHPVTIRPDRAMRRLARSHGWPMLNLV